MAKDLALPGASRPPLALLVDGDADTRQMYAEFLRVASSFNVDQAEDGREALAKALARHPDVIVAETRLPGLSGLDLCRLLRDDRVTEDIPVVFVTTAASERDVKRAASAGADAVLTKPCLPERLAETITRVLTQSHELRARSRVIQKRVGEELARSDRLIARSQTAVRRVMLSHAHMRRETVEPPLAPPALVCPACYRSLDYVKSFLGGVSAKSAEQWDYFECRGGCGMYWYRQRTRKLRRVS